MLILYVSVLSIIMRLFKAVKLVKIGHEQSKPCILTPVEGMAAVQVFGYTPNSSEIVSACAASVLVCGKTGPILLSNFAS